MLTLELECMKKTINKNYVWYNNVSVYLCSAKVEFLGEQGSDTGGLTREFFRLVAYHTSSRYMENTGCFKHNSVALQVTVTRFRTYMKWTIPIFNCNPPVYDLFVLGVSK